MATVLQLDGGIVLRPRAGYGARRKLASVGRWYEWHRLFCKLRCTRPPKLQHLAGMGITNGWNYEHWRDCMTPSEIITADAEHRNLNSKKILATVAQMLGRKIATIMQESNTVLLLNLIDTDAAEVHLFTADKPLTLAKSLIKIINAIRKTNLRVVYGKADSPEILQLLRQIGVNVQESDRPEFNWMTQV